LNGLEWDGQNRIANFASKYLGALSVYRGRRPDHAPWL
jgi:hypothetical protein